jgi:threonine/homoserine/homoserine lactone efflux protein
MIDYVRFLFEAVLISLSGIMAPGPITALTLGEGSESPKAGSFIAVGHGIFEFPLMALLFLGFGFIFNLTLVKTTIGILGGCLLFFMGIGLLKGIHKTEIHSVRNPHHPIVAGILLTAGNPYFLIWWATIGVSLILRSAKYGLIGFLIFAVIHWLCDLIWYTFLSNLSFKGGRFFGAKFQKIVFAVCGTSLIFFSAKFIYDAIKNYPV